MATKKRIKKPAAKKKTTAAKAALAPEPIVEDEETLPPVDEDESDDESDEKSTDKDKDEQDLKLARERFAQAEDAESESRKQAKEDIEFSIGEQWIEEIRLQRQAEGRPCLTINRMPQFIRQVTNEQKQNRPQVKLSPEDNQASIETAKVFQGLIRNIERQSNADIAYDTAFDSAVRSGAGYWRLRVDYCDHNSFDQQILIERIRNRFSVYLDPHRQQPDGSDANWGFVFDDMSEEEFKTTYPEAKLSGVDAWGTIRIDGNWVSEKSVRVAEYYFREWVKTELILLKNNTVIDVSELKEGMEVLDRRKATKPVVHHLKLNGYEVLERSEWPGSWVPIIEVVGEEVDLDGKRITEGVIRHAKDSQRMYNVAKSSETETIALAPRAPYVGYTGQFAGNPAWETANSRSHAYLEANPIVDESNGQVLPLPQRNSFEPAIQAISMSARMHAEDMKATTGIYDGALGAQSNEVSGRAINARKMQAQTSNYHYFDSLAKAKRHSTRQILELCPLIYTRAEVLKIVGEDGRETEVLVNQEFMERGEKKMHDLTKGRYGVAVTVGPGFETKRIETQAALQEVMKISPQAAGVLADIYVRSLDFAGNDEAADRLKKLLPQGVADDKDAPPVSPQLQAQMQSMGQQLEAMTKALNEATDERELKLAEMQSKEKIEMSKIQAQRELKALELQYAGVELQFLQRTKQIESSIARADALETQAIDAAMSPGPAPGQPPMQAPQPLPQEQEMAPGGQQSPVQPPNGVIP